MYKLESTQSPLEVVFMKSEANKCIGEAANEAEAVRREDINRGCRGGAPGGRSTNGTLSFTQGRPRGKPEGFLPPSEGGVVALGPTM